MNIHEVVENTGVRTSQKKNINEKENSPRQRQQVSLKTIFVKIVILFVFTVPIPGDAEILRDMTFENTTIAPIAFLPCV
jgi:hypothetical protein